ncbi:MAG: sigma-54 dependent transcriptional regulator [Candidatus Cloacimonetes bacterium]|nr:sigma-54 dependent transcriptional regulator [Candidatus Cloacimonadota bacterium]
MSKLTILVLDDEKRITDELKEYLEHRKFKVYTAQKPSSAFELMKSKRIDILLLDIRLPEISGLEVLKKIKNLFPKIEVIMITGHGNMEIVIKAMRLGAIDFLNKPFHHLDVKIAIERTSKFVELQNELTVSNNKNSLISQELEQLLDKKLIGESDAIKEVLKITMRATEFDDVNVLITGESGTGKEIIARLIHYASVRKKFGFYPVNCSAVPDTLMESEFFGHKKGSFTGAFKDKKGLFELTHQGTLFLDEISDMPFALQAKLLRVIEDKKIKKIGDDKEIEIDVRIVAATNKDIKMLIKKNEFRLDLYHRMNTIEINILPLRERTDDIKPLILHFVEEFSKKIKKIVPKIDKKVFEILKDYSFPGNIRELKNLVERAMIISDNNALTIDDFPITFKKKRTDVITKIRNLNLIDNEKILVREALFETKNNRTHAAKLLGLSRFALIRRMQKYEIEVD